MEVKCKVDIWTKGWIRKSVYTTVEVEGITYYCYSDLALVGKLGDYEVDKEEIDKALELAREVESGILFLKHSFFIGDKIKKDFKL